MVQLTNLLMALLAASSATSALAARRAIRQNINDSTRPWEHACMKAKGGSLCDIISKNASSSLRSGSAPCDQQQAADKMVDLAKILNNTDMIRLSQIFVQQPHDEDNGLPVPYCQTMPKNAELRGFYHCQFSGSNFTMFSGNRTVGNLPPGVSAVAPPGSCPASNSSVPNGRQLHKLVSSPGTPNRSSIVSRITSHMVHTTSCNGTVYTPSGNGTDHTHFCNGTVYNHSCNETIHTHSCNATIQAHPCNATVHTLPCNETDHTHSCNATVPTLFHTVPTPSHTILTPSHTIPTPSGNVSSHLNNGTAPSPKVSLFSNLLSSNILSSPPTPIPGNILRRAKETGMKDAKPEHFRSNSGRVRPRPQHEHEHKHVPARLEKFRKYRQDKSKFGHGRVRSGEEKFAHTRSELDHSEPMP